jgi:uncharacterized protein
MQNFTLGFFMSKVFRFAGVVLSLSVAASAGAQNVPATAADSDRAYDKTEVMIPMRDGVKLHTMILRPRGMTEPLPFIMLRTPYGIAGGERSLTGNLLAREGYIFAFQDIRGRYTSEGTFVMMRQMRDKKDPKAVDESTDAYDTVDWLIKNVPNNNGKVGMKGVSYPGWTTVMAMVDPHPALKAASPQASPADMFIGDDFHHNGAFRLSYGFEYATMMEGSREQQRFAFGDSDTYNWYLKLGSLANVNPKYLQGKIPTWNDFAGHPNWDAFWQRQAVLWQLDRPRVPGLHVAGWWDQEDFYGPVRIYQALEKRDTANINFLVVGPWNHGGWGGQSGQKLGPVDFGSHTSRHFRENIEAPWFAYWLKGKGKLSLPEATTFEAGTNTWRGYDDWPPTTNVSARRLYFQGQGKLSFQPPQTTPSDSGYDSYVSDPANPVPYRARPIRPLFQQGSTWSRWLMDDQRFLKGRPDVVNWETPPLEEDVTIAGKVMAHLFAATSGSDADWVVKLIDVYPETEPDTVMRGYELMVANDVLRGRFRKSFEKPDSVVPNKVEEYTIDLHTQNYRFRKGHRIKVQVQSSWFPLIDRNPQKWVPNIFEAKDTDFIKATQRVYRSRNAASYLQVDVVGRDPIRP